MKTVSDLTGAPPLRRSQANFRGLARIVVGQQLSIASANAIWTRIEQNVTPLTETQLIKLPDEALKNCGLSAAKIRTLRAICGASQRGLLDFAKLGTVDDASVHATLTEVKGVGPWTADIFIMFCLGRADGWAPGDLALRHAVKAILEQEDLPTQPQMVDVAERWRPWRGVAARLLWSYYAILKDENAKQPV